MGRRAKPAKVEAEAKRPFTRKAPKKGAPRAHELEKRLAEAHAQVTEGLEQQTATSKILRVISSSPTDVQPVFDTIAESAVRLCGGLFSGLFQFDGELIQHVAWHNVTPEALEEMRRIFPARPTRALMTGRAILERAVVHIPEVLELDLELSVQVVGRTLGFRSGLWVPMLREGTPIGVIAVTRADPGLIRSCHADPQRARIGGPSGALA